MPARARLSPVRSLAHPRSTILGRSVVIVVIVIIVVVVVVVAFAVVAFVAVVVGRAASSPVSSSTSTRISSVRFARRDDGVIHPWMDGFVDTLLWVCIEWYFILMR